ncbi:MAG: hypothetical protein KDD43_02750 [Bdellovibrionales bacterium]|nr:hypothetical protein [Bdellovibrionales bacterium]
MARVKLADDGSSIDFQTSDTLPSSLKKFRRSPEVEGFYRFVYENDLRFEAGEILDKIILRRRQEKKAKRKKP